MQKRSARLTQEEFDLTMKLLSDLEISIRDGHIPYLEHTLYTEWRTEFKTRDKSKVYIFAPIFEETLRLSGFRDATYEVARPLYDSYLCDALILTFMRYVIPEIEGYELDDEGFRFYDINSRVVGKFFHKKGHPNMSLNATKIAAMLYILNDNVMPDEFNRWAVTVNAI